MVEAKIGDRVWVAICRTCQKQIILAIDPTRGKAEIIGEPGAQIGVECPDCKLTHLYAPAEIQWGYIAANH